MNDTPKTDAQIHTLPQMLTGWASFTDTAQVVPADFARYLERENAALRKDLAQVTADFHAMCPHESWEKCDDSFSHEFGKQIIRYIRCEKCGKISEPGDVEYPEDDDEPRIARDETDSP